MVTYPPASSAQRPLRLSSPRRVQERLYLGARTLASLNMPDVCPACFYVRLKCRRDLPYQFHMPAILFAADRHVKEAVHRSIDAGKGMPPWMPARGDVKGYVPGLSFRWFRHLDRRTNVSVCGVPDDLLVMGDGTVHVVDYKTAFLTQQQREILPLYKAQVNVYAYVARRVGRRVPGPVRDLTLAYLEPQPDFSNEQALAMRFVAKTISVRNEAEALVPRLLQRAREIMSQEAVPRHREGCEELERMNTLMEAQTGDPFVATYGRYHRGRCLTCGERHLLVPDQQVCFLCFEMESW